MESTTLRSGTREVPGYTVTAMASDLAEGDRYTDHLAQTHTVTTVDTTAGGTHNGIYVHVEGQGHPEFYLAAQEITLHVPDAVDTAAFEEAPDQPRFSEGDSVTVLGCHDIVSSDALDDGELSEEVVGQTEPWASLTVVSVESGLEPSYNLRDEDGNRVWDVRESDLHMEEPTHGPAFRTLTRRHLGNGNCIKASATFHTRAAQVRYAASLPSHTAISAEH